MVDIKEKLEKDGYIILRNFFEREKIIKLLLETQDIFDIQFSNLGYKSGDGVYLKEGMIRLFQEHEEVFKNCGKLIQTGSPRLYKLATNKKLINQIKELGVEFPFMCTRPVLFFNHPQLAKSEEYYKTPKHQDWPSMQSSQNSLVVWVPLVDVNKENGSIIIYPGSHKKGILPFKTTGGFAEVEYEGESIQPEMKVGDIAIFSTKLVHESGPILNDTIRWSCHFRYTDMLENDFIERGYPSPYVYKPITKM